MNSSSSEAGGIASPPPPPPPPVRVPPDPAWSHAALHSRVQEALLSLPFYFRTETFIEGIVATDIFTLNSALGATIENQVVATLNAMRAVWDPEERYSLYSFVRQSQTFPDVLLRRADTGGDPEHGILFGIELKGWYLLAKEGEPSFRYAATPAASAPEDLIVVVPWVLGNVIAGSPRVYTPYVESARYAAEYRNHHWTHLRKAKGETGLVTPPNVQPYPRKANPISDRPVSDSGGNFGRFARTGIMDAYLAQTKAQPLCGIAAEHWLAFFSLFQDQSDRTRVGAELVRLQGKLAEAASVADVSPNDVTASWEVWRDIIAQVEALLLKQR